MPSGGLAVAGELSRATGIGETGRLMLRALEFLRVPNWSIDLSSRATSRGSQLPPGVPLVIHINSPDLPRVLLRAPRRLSQERLVVGYWVWELPYLSSDWKRGLPFVHEVWVPSRFVAQSIEPLLPGKVRVVPPALAVAAQEPITPNRATLGLPEDAVVVLVSFNLASSFERKNPLAAIAAFRAAFGDRQDRILLLKIGNPNHFSRDSVRIDAAIAGASNIRLETRGFSTADNYALIAASDIVLSTHRAEGFGLVPAEAMLLGKPVIATGWSGNMDYMDRESAILLDYQLVPARDPRLVYELPGAYWAEPDLDQAVTHLRRLADDPAGRLALGCRAKEAALSRLGVAPLVDALQKMGIHPPPFWESPSPSSTGL